MLLSEAETNNIEGVKGKPTICLSGSETLCMRGNSSHGTWEILSLAHDEQMGLLGQSRWNRPGYAQEVGQVHSTGEIDEQSR